MVAAWILAAGIAVSARAQSAAGQVGEKISVEVDVRGPGLSTAMVAAGEMPDGLEIGHAQGPRLERRQQLHPGNRQVQIERLVWIFDVTPTRPGTFVVPPFTITAGTWTEKTEPFAIRATGTFDPRKLVFVETRVDPRPRWVGEPIAVELVAGVAGEWVSRVIEGETSLHAPWMTEGLGPGALPEGDLAAERAGIEMRTSNSEALRMLPGQETRGGNRFSTLTSINRFVPTRDGTLTVGPTSYRAVIATEVERDPIFDTEVPTRTKLASVSAPPVKIRVKPLPLPRPDGFSGLVGRLSIEVEASSRRLKVGDSLRVTVTVRGDGNLGSTSLPRVEIPGFKRFGVVEEVEEDSSSRRLVYDLAPLSTDSREIPPFELEIFDAAAGRYATLATKPIRLDVLPGAAVALAAGTAATPDATPSPAIRREPSPAGAAAIAWGPLLVTGVLFTSAPLAAYAAYALLVRRRAAAPAPRRRDRARATLDGALVSLPRDPRAAAAHVAAAMTRFLADLADAPPESFRGVDLDAALLPHLDAPLRKRVVQLVHDAERAAFGDGRADVASLARTAAGIANALESGFRSRV